MLGHPRLGRIVGSAGMLTAAALLAFNFATFPVPPADTLQDVRSQIVLALEESGVPVEVHHHG